MATKAKRLELERPDPAAKPKYPGVQMQLAGKSYVVPGLSIAYVRANGDKIKALDSASDDYLTIVIEMTLAALQRNYPEMTTTDVEEFLDLNNVSELIAVITGREKKPRESIAVAEIGAT